MKLTIKYKHTIEIGLLVILLAISTITLKALNDKQNNCFLDSLNNEWDYKCILTPFKPSKKGYSILVDLDNLILTLYKDANEEKTWPVSGGSEENPSPIGSWFVTGIENWGSSFGGSWIELNVPWGIYGIHGTTKPWVVGHNNISHGCIRMINADAEELKNIITVGVPVHIKYDNIPFRILSKGEVGSDVLILQVMLMNLGYFSDAPDGEFGSNTFDALRQFQSNEKLKSDGILGIQTWDLLKKRIEEL